MKKSKLLVLALVAVLMTVGLVLAGCHLGCDGAGTCKTTKGGSSSLTYQQGSTCTTSSCATHKKVEADCDC